MYRKSSKFCTSVIFKGNNGVWNTIVYCVLLFLLPSVLLAKPIDTPKTFKEAKTHVRQIFADMPFTFYCHCTFNSKLVVDHQTCGYKPRKDIQRANRVEIEHIVPAENFGRGMQSKCWQTPICKKDNGATYKGRECCLASDPLFVCMHNDLHNLVPAIGEINGDRSNFRFAELTRSDFQYGECQFKIDFNSRKVEPRDAVKGAVARAYLYFNAQYGLRLSEQQQALFNLWNNSYPPEAWEITWDNRAAAVQGNHNQYINAWDEYHNQ